MDIKKVFIIYVIVVLIFSCRVYCSDEAEKNYVNIYSEQREDKLIDEETYKCINNLINEISKELRQIDGKLDKARIMESYERYPLIRLNIDSPYFGIVAITESKLDVKDSISTLDIAKGYSIRSIINSRTILVEDVELTNIVISTKQVKISDNMLQKDAILCLEKLIIYLEQAKNANKFVDMQLKNTFKEYYSQDKNMNIMYIRNEINNINEILKDVEDVLMKISLTTTLDVSENLNKCNDFKLENIEFEKIIDNPMSNEDELEQSVTNIISLKCQLMEFSTSINSEYEKYKEVNINILLQNAIIDMNEKINFIEDEEKLIYEKEDEEKSNFSNKYISSAKKYRDELSDLLASGKYNNQSLDFSEEQIKLEINKIYGIYLNFLNSYNSALTQRIKYVVTNLKQIGLENLKITSELMYIYIQLDEELLQISDYFEKNNVYSNVICIEKLQNLVTKVYNLQNNVLEE